MLPTVCNHVFRDCRQDVGVDDNIVVALPKTTQAIQKYQKQSVTLLLFLDTWFYIICISI